ncbi:hypothetical protein BD410DRAFT_789801 [Rickenella mellea]|uniref:Uncharacterized protein n=1 Tax=Rickenella mellea TaxID=50990 RepID=A0A4Y7Q1S8_9AGAM|nr:hypothetical protein BD410DRAFT_789801 [Rickenella mellea]
MSLPPSLLSLLSLLSIYIVLDIMIRTLREPLDLRISYHDPVWNEGLGWDRTTVHR